MHKVLTLSITLLALGALVAVPGIASDMDAEAQVDLVEEEALMSPAETPELPEVIPGDSMREDKIRACTEAEAATCPPGTACVVVGGVVDCLC